MSESGDHVVGGPLDQGDAQGAAEDRQTVRDQIRDILVAGVFTLFGVVVAVTAARTPEPFRSVDVLGPNRFPLMVGTLIAVCGLFVMIKTGYHYFRGTFQNGQFDIPGQASDEPGKPASGVRAAAVMALLVVHVVLWDSLGFLLASVLFVIIGMRMMSESSWRLVLTSAFGYAIITFVVFGLFLNVALPLGVEEQLFVRLGIVEQVR